jgi:hypothetical protein
LHTNLGYGFKLKELPEQPAAFISYLRVGRLLYYSLFLFILESWFYWVKLKAAYYESPKWVILFWMACFLFSFVHIFLVIMDGWSRYQNYKRAKDQFYMYGFTKRISNLYIGSKCQRMAALVAAKELGLEDQVNEYYASKGIKWYHYVPYFMIKDPLFLFKKYFWKRSFLEKTYEPKFNFKKLQLQLSL